MGLRNAILVALVSCAAACGGGDDQSARTCQPDDRTGTYLVQYAQTGGDCLPRQPEIVDFVAGYPNLQAGCTITDEDWTDGDCRAVHRVRCDLKAPDGSDVTELWRLETTQTDDHGAILDGTLGIDFDATVSCAGSYSVHAQRQSGG